MELARSDEKAPARAPRPRRATKKQGPEELGGARPRRPQITAPAAPPLQPPSSLATAAAASEATPEEASPRSRRRRGAHAGRQEGGGGRVGGRPAIRLRDESIRSSVFETSLATTLCYVQTHLRYFAKPSGDEDCLALALAWRFAECPCVRAREHL